MNKKVLKNRKKIILDFICAKNYRPMRAKDIAALLQIPKGKRKDLRQVLDSLEEEGKITCSKRGLYRRAAQEEAEHKSERPTACGTFIAHPRGFGFVEVEGQPEDIFIPESHTGGAFHQDQVEVALEPPRKNRRQEGRIVKVLSRGVTEVVGTYERRGQGGTVLPDNDRLLMEVRIPAPDTLGAGDGQKVVAVITSYQGSRDPRGRITEILGNVGEAGVDVLSIARGQGLPMDFPEKVKNQAQRVPEQIQPGDFDGRLDLRDWTVITIDGEDAKDLDDGISLTKDRESGLYHLGVHIADVSNYVQEDSALDREARKRGTSVYLVDRVIPMLPQRLSNGICSLNQGEDRLALSCLMDIDAKGNVVSHKIAETVIKVTRRMSYTQVKEILEDKDPERIREFKKLVPTIRRMGRLSKVLRKKRMRRGAIDFDFPESKVTLSPMGRPVDIQPYLHNTATQLIEDFMLLANETVAEEFCKREIPFVYRTHETPDMEKMEGVLAFIRSQGIKVKKTKEEIEPLEIQKILTKIEGEPAEPLISRLLLRSMKQARYTTGCSGHFGLAAKHYCHFTSPIRRYPDLQIHRIIKDTLRGRMNQQRMLHYAGILEEVAAQSSAMERRAEETERETVKLKKAEYMSFFLGQEFSGVISGVTGWGFYVELPNTVEGLVHINSLKDDYYAYDEENYRLVGEKYGQVYSLGQPVAVKVLQADISSRTIDFVLA